MKKPVLLYLAVTAAIAGLGWWAYGIHRGSGPVLEIAAPGTPSQAATARRDDATLQDPPGPSAPGGAPGAAAGRRQGGAGGPAGPGGGRGPVGVEAALAQRVSLVETVAAVGTLRANETVIIKPEIAGRVERINFDGGAQVRKGDLLVALDASVAAAEADQTRAELSLARSNYQRTADLAAQKFVSESARDQAASNLKVVEAKLKLAEAKLSKTEIRAPFSGVLGLRNFSVGDYVREGAELVVLEDVSQMKVDLRLPERYLGQLRRGQLLEVEFDAYPSRRFNATLEAVDVQVDVNGRSVIARGRLVNPNGLLRTGMFAKGALTLSQRPSAVMIPEEAVFPAGADQFVYLVNDAGQAVRTKIRTGLRRDGKVEIVDGVRVGEQVITAGQLKLGGQERAEVRVINPPQRGG